MEVQQKLQDDQSVNSGAEVVHHNARALRQLFKPADWEGLRDIECTEEYKAREQWFPKDGARDERDELSGDLVDHHVLRIFPAATAGLASGRRDTDRRDRDDEY